MSPITTLGKEKLQGTSLAAVGVGIVFIWSGIRGVSVLAGIESLITGKQPSSTETQLLADPNASGGSGSSPSGGSGNYKNPFRGVHLTPERIDQGVDYSGSGPVYAIGNGKVISASGSGWPGGPYILYQLTDGSNSGSYVYIAENITANVHAGQQVTPDTVICHMHGGIETGWGSQTVSVSLAHANGHTSFPTPEGLHFNDFLKSLGAPGGIR